MSETAVYCQPAFILQQRKYRETSLLIEVLTRDFGRLSLLARDVRKAKSRTIGLLQPFIPLTVSFAGKAELKCLTGVERIQHWGELSGLALYCGFYVNELVAHFLHRHDPHPEVFGCYRECLRVLASGDSMETALRRFELHLLQHAGYGLQLDHDSRSERPVDPEKRYRFSIEDGPIEAVDGDFSGKTLRALETGEFNDPMVLREAKILLRSAIDAHMQGKPLNSRSVINTLIKQSKHE